MSTALDDIAFLANSENRLAVLQCLSDGPHSRHVVAEKTGVSRVTLGRILTELADRRWITQYGQICNITTLGEWIIEEFSDLYEMMDAADSLRTVYQWFPEDGYDFHISCLADAEITLVSRADASAPISTLVKQFDIGGPLRAFSFAITSQFLDACWRHVVDGSITWEWVFTSEVLDVLKTNPEMASQSRDILESGNAEFRLYEGEIPYVVIISEERVNLRLAAEDGSATALIQTDNGQVRTWADSTFNRYWYDATLVSSDVFTP